MTELIETSVEDGIADIRFNRSAALNTTSVAMAEAFAGAVERVIADRATRGTVFSGSGRSFMAGGDLRAFQETRIADRPELGQRIISPMHRVLKGLERADILSLPALHGSVAGAAWPNLACRRDRPRDVMIVPSGGYGRGGGGGGKEWGTLAGDWPSLRVGLQMA
jgi:enoyl-CoA hydratase/carnithine racemase